MPLRFAINGFGRIGRALLRIAWSREGLLPVALNDVVPARQLAPLLARDSVHGPFGEPVEVDASGALAIGGSGGRRIPFFQEDDPARVPWGTAGAEIVVEATGRFLRRGQAAAHLRDGVRAVILSANADPAEPADATFCLGLRAPEPAAAPVAGVVSNASCTTNCLALLADVLHRGFGVRRAVMSTVHSYTENQRLLDLPHPDPRRARAAAVNIIPTSTTAARSLGLILPELAGRIDGFAVRVPTPAVALLDLVADLERDTTAEEIRTAYREAAAGRLAGVLGVTGEELVSVDFVNDPRSAVVDLPLVQVVDGRMARVVAWYDNEWGYATRLADLLERMT
ncbi:MAG TPA: glyceraldehyde 3-phosphate dehydrogenase NAD-binding domain-containing protein [Thermoanaerobaculia bacterium]|jgi:glyceraldehyde 3-phosphate dehydrogenase|nr:glyceraldehyde 3-phosphate dehydrogenase NAD-binding domain-containing protein [Thermoanaerobaculia bacterium]